MLALVLVAIIGACPGRASADAIIAAGSDVISCQAAGTCVQVPVTITGIPRPVDFAGVRGVHVSLKIEGNIELCTDPAASNFTQGDFLTTGGATTSGLQVVSDAATGTFTIDQAILGDPPCRDADAGTLFTLTVKSIAATGNGTITITDVSVRDCNNAAIAAAPGAPATIAFNGGGGEPLKLKITAVPPKIWPPNGGLHDIHIDATTTGGCGPVVILLSKIVVRCKGEHDGDDDDDGKDLGTSSLNRDPLPGDVVDADFGQPDFDFKLRARECDERKERLDLKASEDCEHSCRDDCKAESNREVDYQCNRIRDHEERERCKEEQREDRERFVDKCEDDCGDNCEHDKDLVYWITYTASSSEDRGTIVSATTSVRVEHSTIMAATATLDPHGGPSEQPNSPSNAGSLDVLIPSDSQLQVAGGTTASSTLDRSFMGDVAKTKPKFNAVNIDPSQIFLGDADGLVAATRSDIADVNQDGIKDLVARFQDDRLRVVHDLSIRPGAHIELYFRDFSGNGYTVPNVLGDSWSWPVSPAPRPGPGRGGEPAALTPNLLPRVTNLQPAYPNPARGQVSLIFELANAGEVKVEVFDLRGAKVRTMVDGVQPAGRQVLKWDGLDDAGHSVPDGMYLVRARAANFKATRSTIFIK